MQTTTPTTASPELHTQDEQLHTQVPAHADRHELRELITRAGFETQTAAAAALGVTQGTLSQVLSGSCSCHRSYILHAAQIIRAQEAESALAAARVEIEALQARVKNLSAKH